MNCKQSNMTAIAGTNENLSCKIALGHTALPISQANGRLAQPINFLLMQPNAVAATIAKCRRTMHKLRPVMVSFGHLHEQENQEET
jgi:hypothetical protein